MSLVVWAALQLLALWGPRQLAAFSIEPVHQPVDYSRWVVLGLQLWRDDEQQPAMTAEQLDDMPGSSLLKMRRLTGEAEVMVSPDDLDDVMQILDDHKVPHTTLVNDLGSKMAAFPGAIRSQSLAKGAVTFDRFMTYEEIDSYLEELPAQYPGVASVRTMGTTHEGRPIRMVTLTTAPPRTSPGVIFLDGGIHAREWVSPAAVMNTMQKLLASPDMTRNIEWRIMPLLNPDGYKATWTVDRMWRKNRARNRGSSCQGVDLNRNFGFHWAESGSSSRPCSNIYHGPAPFSEPESRALRDALLETKTRNQAYVTFHSYGQMVLFPWGYSKTEKIQHAACLRRVGNKMAEIIQRKQGKNYVVGTPPEILYEAAGGSDDWAAGTAKVPISFTIELRDEGANGFLLSESQIIPTVEDAWLAVKHLAKQVNNNYAASSTSQSGSVHCRDTPQKLAQQRPNQQKPRPVFPPPFITEGAQGSARDDTAAEVLDEEQSVEETLKTTAEGTLGTRVAGETLSNTAEAAQVVRTAGEAENRPPPLAKTRMNVNDPTAVASQRARLESSSSSEENSSQHSSEED